VNGGAGTGQATLLTTIVSVDPIYAMCDPGARVFALSGLREQVSARAARERD